MGNKRKKREKDYVFEMMFPTRMVKARLLVLFHCGPSIASYSDALLIRGMLAAVINRHQNV